MNPSNEWHESLERILDHLTRDLALPERVIKTFDMAGWSWDWRWDCPEYGAVAGISLLARPAEYDMPAAAYIEIAGYAWLAANREAYWYQSLTAWYVELDKPVLTAKYLRHSLQRAQKYAGRLAERVEKLHAQRQERHREVARLCEAINRGTKP